MNSRRWTTTRERKEIEVRLRLTAAAPFGFELHSFPVREEEGHPAHPCPFLPTAHFRLPHPHAHHPLPPPRNPPEDTRAGSPMAAGCFAWPRDRRGARVVPQDLARLPRDALRAWPRDRACVAASRPRSAGCAFAQASSRPGVLFSNLSAIGGPNRLVPDLKRAETLASLSHKRLRCSGSEPAYVSRVRAFDRV